MASTKIFRPTIARIHRRALQHNLERVRSLAGAHVMAMVKADAYGHGAVRIAQWLSEMGVQAFGVATIEEGVELRGAGIREDIIVMGGVTGLDPAAADVCETHHLIPVLHSASDVGVLQNRPLRVHIKVDTGMSRLGATPQELPALLSALKSSPSLKIDGMMTHLADAGNAESVTCQLRVWSKCVKEARLTVGTIPNIHMGGSAAVLRHVMPEVAPGEQFWFRPGIALYGSGAYPGDAEGLESVMTLDSRVILVKSLPKGASVSYGWTYTLPREGRIAIVPIGYADGFPWSAKGRAQVLIRGQLFPVVGRVTMDMIMVDVTSDINIQGGDEVVMMGQQGSMRLTADDLAQWSDTISYEIMCGISRRIPREYVE